MDRTIRIFEDFQCKWKLNVKQRISSILLLKTPEISNKSNTDSENDNENDE